MNGIRIALAGCVIACAWAAWPAREAVRGAAWPTRQFVVHSTLARLDDAVIVLGDSIVEASTLPRKICGHPVVNAGFGGASTSSGLGAILAQALDGKQAALVVVSLGTNDAAIPDSVERYRANYQALLNELAALSQRRAIAAIPVPEAGLRESGKVSPAAVDDYNAMLPKLAEEARVQFIALPEMPVRHTLDGIHLNAAGYRLWDKAILDGIDAALCKSAETVTMRLARTPE